LIKHKRGDITKIDISKLPDHDILTGGFPCQPFSRNNMTRIRHNVQQGNTDLKVDETDDRSVLFTKLVEILEIKKPKIFIFENVQQLCKMMYGDEKVIDTIVDACTDAGYNVQYTVLDAQYFGVPQQRKRVFIVGVRKDISKTFVFPTKSDSTLTVEDILETGSVDSKYYVSNAWKTKKTLKKHLGTKVKVKKEPNDTSTQPTDEKYELRNPHDKDELRLTVLGRNYKPYIYIEPKEKTSLVSGKIILASVLLGDTPSGISRQHDRIYSIKGISRTLATFGHPAFDMNSDNVKQWRMLTARECARLQGFTENFKLHSRKDIALKQLGNAVCVNVVKAVALSLLDNQRN